MNTTWDNYYTLVYSYYEQNKNIQLEDNVVINNINITAWLRDQRKSYRELKLNKRQIKLLEFINIDWWYKCTWFDVYKVLESYYLTHYNLNINDDYLIDSSYLKDWLANQRLDKARGHLPKTKVKLLNTIGMNWTLHNDFDELFNIAKKYYDENGDLNIKSDEIIDGIKLKSWVDAQSLLYKNGTLSSEKKEKLESIGIVWRLKEYSWKNMYNELEKYYIEHHNIDIRGRRKINGYPLGVWLSYQRKLYKLGKLSKNHIYKLNNLGMVWIVNASWEEMYEIAKRYYIENGNLDVSKSEKYGELKLGKWISTQRCAYKNELLSKNKIKLLESIGMIWFPKIEKDDSLWFYLYNKVYEYYKNYCNLNIPNNYVVYGISLKEWLSRQFEKYDKNELSEDKIEKMNKLGFKKNKNPDDNWKIYYGYAKEYYTKYHNLYVPIDYCVNGCELGKWINRMRIMYDNKILSNEYIGKLTLIDMVWNLDKDELKQKELNSIFDVNKIVKKYGYEALYNFLVMIDSKIDDKEINNIINIIKDMYGIDGYNLFVLYVLGIKYNKIASLFDITALQVELIRLKIYKVILFEIKNDFEKADKEYIKRIINL